MKKFIKKHPCMISITLVTIFCYCWPTLGDFNAAWLCVFFVLFPFGICGDKDLSDGKYLEYLDDEE